MRLSGAVGKLLQTVLHRNIDVEEEFDLLLGLRIVERNLVVSWKRARRPHSR